MLLNGQQQYDSVLRLGCLLLIPHHDEQGWFGPRP